MRKTILTFILGMCWAFAAFATGSDTTLQPCSILNMSQSGSSNPGQLSFAASFTTGGGNAGFQVPAKLNGAPVTNNPIQWQFYNSGTNVVFIAAGPTSQSVATPTIPAAGTNTIGAGANTFPVGPGVGAIYSFAPGTYFNGISASGTNVVYFTACVGN